MFPALRTALPEDAPTIARLSGQLGYPASDEDIGERLEAVLSDSQHYVVVAVLDGQVVGWAQGSQVLRLESGCFAELVGLVVDADHRNKGIGRLLVEEIQGWARAHNSSKLRVRCNRLRTETHRFYQGMGFELNKEQLVFDLKIETDD